MNKVIVFAGTTEGREICSFLKKYSVLSLACTATEYGKCRIEEGGTLTVRSGRLTEQEMEQLFDTEQPEIVIDATHPYADLVSENIRSACKRAEKTYLRLLRPSLAADPACIMVDTTEEAVSYLADTTGNILVTTGSKELAKFTKLPGYEKRIYARILPLPNVIASCAELGFDAAHTIGMQGPFSVEMNLAMLQAFRAEWMVTKESGRNGGFEEKIEAAKKAGVRVVLIGRPKEEEGLSENEVKRYLAEKFHLSVRRKVVIAGIGPGAEKQMTLALIEACEQADVLIGAGRMIKAVEKYQKPMLVEYSPEKIYDYLKRHPEYENIVLLQSGDVGFYSGAKKLQAVLAGDEQFSVRIEPGIPSLVYFCAKIGVPWEDAAFVSLHGKHCNFMETVRRNQKTLAIAGGKGSVNELCRTLCTYGWEQIVLHVGTDLSYPEERIVTGTADELAKMEFAPLAVVLFENPSPEPEFTAGMADEKFLRDKVPMTKREVRNASLSHLQLSSDSIVYDIGAGTGSVSIEMALRAAQGKVYAIEKNPVAVALLQENKKKFGVDHLEIIEGTAPEALDGLPIPTHAFIGGSAGNLKEILELLLQKNPRIRVVLNTVTVETLAEAVACFKELAFEEPDIVCLQASNAKKAGKSHLMIAQNPVYLFTTQGGVRE